MKQALKLLKYLYIRRFIFAINLKYDYIIYTINIFKSTVFILSFAMLHGIVDLFLLNLLCLQIVLFDQFYNLTAEDSLLKIYVRHKPKFKSKHLVVHMLAHQKPIKCAKPTHAVDWNCFFE